MIPWEECLVESMLCYIGRTVTIFTTSGGLSGSGFTGVLLAASCKGAKLLTDIGAAPACPIGSSCTNVMTPCGMGGGFNQPLCGDALGSVVDIPICAIDAFVHSTI